MSTRKPSSLNHANARQHFAKAALHYDDNAVIQREIADRLLERLSILKLQPERIIDIGCGTGYSLPTLHERYPEAQVWGLDFAVPMLLRAREHTDSANQTKGISEFKRWLQKTLSPFSASPYGWVAGDLAQLPLQTASMHLLHSSLALQWSFDRLPQVFAEWQRILAVNGVVFFATLGPDTLKELRDAFATVDANPRIHQFLDMHDIGDELVHAGFADPVMEMEKLTVQYSTPEAIFKDLKGIGAVNADTSRSKGLMGKQRWKQLFSAWEASGQEGKWPVTYEVIYGHAWKTAPKLPEGSSPIQFYPQGSR